MGLLLIILIVFLFIYCSISTPEKTSPSKKKLTKFELVTTFLPRTLVRTEEPDPNFYCINIPIKIHNLHRISANNLERVHFDLIYFSLYKGDFSVGETKISYDLKELYEIFQSAIQGQKPTIYVNLLSRKLTVFPEGSQKIHELIRLRHLYTELKSVEQDLEKLDRELAKVESLVNTIQTSELYQYQVETYQKGLSLLKQSQSKATEVRNEYLKFLREYTLSFYLEDVEPTVFQAENKEIAWTAKYRLFKEDYNLLQSMIEEYNKLKPGS